jgi:hypothetical protein
MARNFLTKERAVVDFVKEHFSEYTLTLNKQIPNSCGIKHRPDISLDLGDHIIVIEIDEGQHRAYDTTCEISRTNRIVEAFGYISTSFIRFNPDAYTNEENKRIPTVWTTNKLTGLLSLNSHKKKKWGERLQTLSNTIQSMIATKTNFEVKYLFYDNPN